VIRTFFPTPVAPAKFNPIVAMKQLFRIMIRDEPSLVLRTFTNDEQIVIASESLPSGEKAFKEYFKVSTTRIEKQNQTHICIGCFVLSNRSISSIKFNSTDNHFLTWLKKERVFVESDSLGVDRPVTIGHFTKIAPEITHLANFRKHLVDQMMVINITAETAIELVPHLKTEQLEAMTNGNEYIPTLPQFEVYKTRISYGRAPSQVHSEVLGIKCEPRDAKLLGEFFTRLASETTNDHRNGIFLPKGAAYLLGTATYEQILQDNNFFLTKVATIPVNLEYDAWFVPIDPHTTSETDPISLYDTLLCQPWFLQVELVTRNKCFIVTTQPNLPEARAWIDANLETLIRQSIPQGIDPPSSLLPRHLDKPIYTNASHTYADILKKQFSLVSTPTTNTTAATKPPRKRQATIIEYDLDQSADSPISNAATLAATSTTCQSIPTTTTPQTAGYATELLSLKTEIDSLKTTIATAVEQITAAIKSLIDTPCTQSNAMDTEVETVATANNINQIQPDIPSLIQNLKQELATIVIETRAMFQQQSLIQMLNKASLPSKT